MDRRKRAAMGNAVAAFLWGDRVLAGSKKTSAAIGAGLACLIAGLLAYIWFFGPKVDPADPISPEHEAFSASQMYVTPGSIGADNGGQGDDPNSDSESSEESQDQEEESENAPVNPLQTVLATQGSVVPGNSGASSGGSGGSGGGSGGTGTGSGSGGTASDDNTPGSNTTGGDSGQVIPGISTNLGEFIEVSASTRAPSTASFTYSGRSGLNRNDKLLYFYAIPSDSTGGYSVLVEYSNSSTGGETRVLEGDNGLFALPIELSDGATTKVTLTLVNSNGGRTGTSLDYDIVYAGRKGPTIEISIEEGASVSTGTYGFTVKANDCDGAEIWDSGLVVTATADSGESKTLTYVASSGNTYSYDLDFSSFTPTGDTMTFTVTATATDSSVERASSSVSRTIYYEHHSKGEVLGDVTVIIDATTVGKGIVGSFLVEIHADYPFAQDLCAGLEAAGYRPDYSGSYENNFFLDGISAGGAFANQAIPDTLMHKIEQDKITYNASWSPDSLSTYDWTGNSGWLYCVNGTDWPSRNLSSYVPAPGDSIELIFTLANGKDVGNPSGGSGALSSYCGTWRGGTYTEQHDLSVYVEDPAPTCGAEGKAYYQCSVVGCGAFGSVTGSHADGQYITLPATGNHDYQEDRSQSIEPYDGHDGTRVYVCTVCGASYTEVWPWEDTQTDPDNPDSGGGEVGGQSLDEGDLGLMSVLDWIFGVDEAYAAEGEGQGSASSDSSSQSSASSSAQGAQSEAERAALACIQAMTEALGLGDVSEIYKADQLDPGDGTAEWIAFDIYRAGQTAGASEYLARIEKYVTESYASGEKGLDDYESTTWNRNSIIVHTLGGDPAAIGADEQGQTANLLEDGCYDWAYTDDLGDQGANAWIYALQALDACGVEVPESAKYNKQEMIDSLLACQAQDGSFGLTEGSASGSVDLTGMALAALGPHMADEQVAAAVSKGVEYLASQLGAGGRFDTEEGVTSESISMAVIGLCACGIDPDTDERFVYEGSSLIDGLLSFERDGGGFSHMDDDDLDSFAYLASEQALRALLAYEEFALGGDGNVYTADISLGLIEDASSGGSSILAYVTSGLPSLALGVGVGVVVVFAIWIVRKVRRAKNKRGQT